MRKKHHIYLTYDKRRLLINSLIDIERKRCNTIHIKNCISQDLQNNLVQTRNDW